jgi:transposase
MKSIRKLLRLHYEAKLSLREIAKCTSVSLGAVKNYIQRFEEAALQWPLQDDFTDIDLNERLFPPVQREKYPGLSFAQVLQELKQHKGVTRQLIYEEYSLNSKTKTANPELPSYSQFCRDFRVWLKQRKPSLRHEHKGGEQVQVDYCGPTVSILCQKTGEIRSAQIFVGVLSASNYTFAEATWSQQLPDWIGSHFNMYQFFGGVPELTLTDNLRSGVTKACRYEPLVNETYNQMAEHYRTVIYPVRPYKPKDKAKAENAVLVVERWILARLRHQQFLSLAQLNTEIRSLLHTLNDRPFKVLPGSRRSQFEILDQPKLRALPTRPFEYFDSALVRVGPDYHFKFGNHHYSVPYSFAQQQVELKVTKNVIKVYCQNSLIATHIKCVQPQPATITCPDHRPTAHQKSLPLSDEVWLDWGLERGQATAECVLKLFIEHHPARAHRICVGLQSLAQQHGDQKLEWACQQSLAVGHVSYNSVKLLLKKPDGQMNTSTIINQILHDNIRGPAYYQTQGESYDV